LNYTYGNGLPVEGGRWHKFVFQNKQGGQIVRDRQCI
jgi:hypothetical protein